MPNLRKIFIAEDEEEVFLSLKKLLLFSGFKVEGTMRGGEVVPLVKSFMPEAILLDIRMPELNGLEICSILKSDPATLNIPVFILSALNGQEEISQAEKLGVAGYFSKPYNYLQLKSDIEAVLEKNR